ncbi:hypothetical protein A1O1_09057 [Capronia coronata CBS 617.96]|uniref:Zinc finger C2H2 LYAR-type domain-containing protein n=1 Tax=Capronia coronata CBS 617.96 TaxID=1182541 RepID=W9XNW1_9EURO|nr:uncharacterized protein A1O1_09057 [Capronia coronata CBS 617.96]EXJ78656.1 hypothetical protein A1O1_09057 [Capronia coronata CBS 617.96]
MVSFQCEGCGDVLTKKKLDSHRNHCRGAVFTCIDCMTTFPGTQYRTHTSCMTEDQKYQGALYREKPSKAAKRKSVSIVEPEDTKALVPRKAYVEDVPDTDAPPHAPTPPPAVPDSNRDSVFDYMVDGSAPGTPQIRFSKKEREEMAMKQTAPSIFTGSRPSSQHGYRNAEEKANSKEYEQNGYTWGAEPVKPRGALDMNNSSLSLEFMTPAAKETKSRLDKTARPQVHSRTNSGSEKKRKRPTDDHAHEGDNLLVDTVKADTPGIVHSGLTGGISRMMSQDEEFPFRQSPDTEDRRQLNGKDRSSRRSHKPEDPTSPLKRTRHTKDDPNGLGISIKGHAVKALSMVGGALLPGSQTDSQQSRTRRRASSSEHGQSVVGVREGEKRERKKHKVHRHNGTASSNVRHEHRSRRRTYSDGSPSQGEGTTRKVKAIEYHQQGESGSESDSDPAHRHSNGGGRRKGPNGTMVVFGAEEKAKRACRSFLANAPGLESDKGYSIHKMLKRWHKQNDVRSSTHKAEEEEELWRSLRVRRNERGEYVVIF